jgi:antitoxin CptB
MKNKELLKKKITYSSTHRGFKEMDLLLGSFVKMYLNKLNTSDLIDLHNLLMLEDEIIYEWYFKKKKVFIYKNKVCDLLRNFKL